jgi:uncharacterized membrane protein YgcG
MNFKLLVAVPLIGASLLAQTKNETFLTALEDAIAAKHKVGGGGGNGGGGTGSGGGGGTSGRRNPRRLLPG